MEKGKRERDRGVAGRPIDFLGYQYFKRKTLLRKSTKQRFARKMHRLKDEGKRKKVKASYWGQLIHGNCRHLWNTITDNDMSFLDLGIKQRPQTKDGKKFYDVPNIRLMDIVNIPVTIIDFETGVKTREGEDRYCVLFEMDSKRGKFITNSVSIKDVLDQAREAEQRGNAIFPVYNVVIKRKQIGNGTAYYFEE
jgi:hypothetical protein